MIKEIKNISGASLDWGSGTIQSIDETSVINVWENAYYEKLCEFTTTNKIQVVNYDGSTIDGATAREWARMKMIRIDTDGHYPLIYDLVDPYFMGMPFHAIDYKRNLLSGVKLHAKHTFSNSGLLEKTEYYNGFVDDSNKGVLVLDVVSIWSVDQTETIPVAADVIEREKERNWVNTNNEKNSKKKKGKKKYDTLEKVQEEGKRRRKNAKGSTINKLGMALVLIGEANNAVEAQDIMIDLHHAYNADFSDYSESGKGGIYDSIDNDSTRAWLNEVVPDNPTNQFMIPEAVGKSLRTFTRDKLKGLI